MRKPAPAPPPRKPPSPPPWLSGVVRDLPTPTPAPPKKQDKPPQPKAIPQGPPPQSENSRPGRLGAPHPVLQKYGINDSVKTFNSVVQTIHDSYGKAYGAPPTPGLVFDIARSPLPVHQIATLFQVPRSQFEAQAHAGVQADQKQRPFDYFHVRPDGRIDLHNPLWDFLQHQLDMESKAGQTFTGYKTVQTQTETPSGSLTPATTQVPTYAPQRITPLPKSFSLSHLKQFPWLTEQDMGIPGDLGALMKAMQTVATVPGGPLPEAAGSKTPLAASQAGGAMFGAAPASPQLKHLDAVKTVQQFQDQWRKLYPGWFGDLPSSGTLNPDWAKRIVAFQKSIDYKVGATKVKAEAAGLSPHDYVKAWWHRDSFLKNNPNTFQLYRSVPLQLWVHGHPSAISGGSYEDTFKYLGSSFNWQNPVSYLTTPFEAAGKAAGLGVGVIGGTIDQFKAYGRAWHFVLTHASKVYSSDKHTREEMDAQLRAILDDKKQSWLGIIYPGLEHTTNPYLQALDGVTNIAGDFLILGKVGPGYGEYIPRSPANMSRVLGSRTFKGLTDMSFRDLARKGDLGAAAHKLGGGAAAEQFVAAAENSVKAGTMSLDEYRNLAAHLYNHLEVTVDGKYVSGGLLDSMAWKKLPAPGLPGRSWVRLKDNIKATADNIDQALQESGHAGTDLTRTFLLQTRQLFSHAAPPGLVHYFEPTLPRRLFDYVKNTFHDPQLATKWRSDLVRLRANQDIPGIQDLESKVNALYHERFPIQKKGVTPEEPSKALFLAEAPSRFLLPTGGRAELSNGFDSVLSLVSRANEQLNKLGRVERRIVVSGTPIPGVSIPGFGLTLPQKHLFTDWIRAVVGGGRYSRKTKGAWNEILGLASNDPAFRRQLEVSMTRQEQSEAGWLTGHRSTDYGSVNTADAFPQPGFLGRLNPLTAGIRRERKAKLEAAATYLHRSILNDDALSALQRSSESDLAPLIGFLSAHPQYRQIAFGRAADKIAAQRALEKEQLTPGQLQLPGIDMGKQGLGAAQQEAIHTQAEAMWRRYADFVQGGRAAGFADPVATARSVLQAARPGKRDAALMKWITENQVEFKVKDAVIPTNSALDEWNARYIGFLLSPNKLYRRTLARNVTSHAYADWTKVNPDVPKSVIASAALQLSESVVKYHMLDFSNMLKVERDLRWVVPFSTKHRLYWKWILNTLWREPKYAAMAHDFQQHLDPHGNISLGIDVLGLKLAIPVYRLTWLNSSALPAVSPPVEALAALPGALQEGAKHGWLGAETKIFQGASPFGGNVITRDDQLWLQGIKLAFAQSGHLSAAGAVAGMPAPTAREFNRLVNAFQYRYTHKTGHLAPEADAVKYALYWTMAMTAMKANTIIPSLVPDEKQHTKTQALWAGLDKLHTGAARAKYLQAHPELTMLIGQSKDPEVYKHNLIYRPRMSALFDSLNAQMGAVSDKADAQGYWDPKLETQYRQAVGTFSKQIDALLMDEAKSWQGSPSLRKGEVSGGIVTHPGPLGMELDGNPFLATTILHNLAPNIPQKELDAHTITAPIQQAEQTITLARKHPALFGGKSKASELIITLEDKLQAFRSYPKTAAAQLHHAYMSNHYGPYWQGYAKVLKQFGPGSEERRMFIDSHDHSVQVTVGGKTLVFPSPVRMWFALQDPGRHQKTIARAAADHWANVPLIEKEALLGKPIPRSVSKAWDIYTLSKKAYYGDAQAQKTLLNRYSINITALPPGVRFQTVKRNGKVIYDFAGKDLVKFADDQAQAKGAFVNDFAFSRKPVVARLKTYPYIQQNTQWQSILVTASDFLNRQGWKNAPKTQREDVWQRSYVPKIQAWLQTQTPAFQKEVARYGKHFLDSLVR